jgi:WhiB family redox-sensing transcriptional regulator
MAELGRLPVTVADVWDWQFDASCRTADPRLFFHPEAERGPAKQRRDAAALAVCARCPVIDACRRHALTVREPYGVWGGLTEEDREEIYRVERLRPAVSGEGLRPAANA